MKKKIRLVIAFYILFCSAMLFFDYSTILQNKFEKDCIQIEIVKPNGLPNAEYIQLIKEICRKSNVNIVYKIYNVGDGTQNISSYYITNYNYTFLDKKSEKKLKKMGYLTNNKNDKNFIEYSDFFGITRIYSLDNIITYNLNVTKFWINKNKYENFVPYCIHEGIEVNRINNKIAVTKYLSFDNLLFPSVLLFLTFVIYGIKLRKPVYIKKINGYSDGEIILENLWEEIKYIIIPCTLLIPTTYLLFGCFYPHLITSFIAFSGKIITIIYLILIVLLIIGNKVVCKFIDPSVLKGNDGRKYLFYMTCLLELCFAVFCCTSINTNIQKIRKAYDVYNAYKKTAVNLPQYVTFPVNVSNTDISDSNQLEYNIKFDKFYNDTVDKFQGILIDTRNYRSIRGEKTVAMAFNQIDITVNENYLNTQSIYNNYNQKITKNDLVASKFNVLIPEYISKKEFLKQFNIYNVEKNKVNIIFFKRGTKFLTFNRYSGTDGLIVDPVVYIYNHSYMKNLMLNYISGEYYLAKCDSGNKPYETFYKYLNRYGLENLVPDTPYLINTFTAELATLRFEITEKLFSIILNLIGYFAMLIYTVIEYTVLHDMEIYAKYVNGFSKYSVYFKVIAIQIIFDLLICLYCLYASLMLITIAGYLLFTKIFLIFYLKKVKILEVHHIWEL